MKTESLPLDIHGHAGSWRLPCKVDAGYLRSRWRRTVEYGRTAGKTADAR